MLVIVRVWDVWNPTSWQALVVPSLSRNKYKYKYDICVRKSSSPVYLSSVRLCKSLSQFQVSSAVCPIRRSLIFPNLMQGMEGGFGQDKLLDLMGCEFSYADIHQQENVQGWKLVLCHHFQANFHLIYLIKQIPLINLYPSPYTTLHNILRIKHIYIFLNDSTHTTHSVTVIYLSSAPLTLLRCCCKAPGFCPSVKRSNSQLAMICPWWATSGPPIAAGGGWLVGCLREETKRVAGCKRTWSSLCFQHLLRLVKVVETSWNQQVPVSSCLTSANICLPDMVTHKQLNFQPLQEYREKLSPEEGHWDRDSSLVKGPLGMGKSAKYNEFL